MTTWLLRRLFPAKKCEHEFYIEDIQFTGIAEIPRPTGRGYEVWQQYFRDYYDQDSIKKRVQCDCRRCRETFYAACGLDLPGVLRQRGR